MKYIDIQKQHEKNTLKLAACIALYNQPGMKNVKFSALDLKIRCVIIKKEGKENEYTAIIKDSYETNNRDRNRESDRTA